MLSTRRGVTVNDIALLRIIGRIGFDDKVAPVNLPSADFDQVEETDEEGCGKFDHLCHLFQ